MRLAPIALGLTLAFPCCTAPEPPARVASHEATIPVARSGPALQRHEWINATVREQEPELVFIGDSITEGWEREGMDVWATAYGRRNAANLGISSDRTQHVLWRLENGNVHGISPKLAVVMIGTNNSEDDTPEQIADGITAIVHELRTRLRTTRILLLAIFPRGPDDQDKRRGTNDRVNVLIAGLADDPMVSYLDIGPAFLSPDGTLDSSVMPDLLHLSETGYAIWAEAMEPELQRLLDE